MSKIRIAGVMVAGLVLYGCATTSQKPAATAAKDPNCFTDTGSRLPAGKPTCNGFGRSYSEEDIRRTGSATVGRALALLDPSITVSR